MGIKTKSSGSHSGIIRFLKHHYAKRFEGYLRKHGFQEAKQWRQLYEKRFMKYMSDADFGEQDGKFTSYLNIHSALAAYEILREHGQTEQQGIEVYDDMCAVMRRIAALSYRAFDSLPHGYERVVKSLTDDMDGPKSVCWETEEIERSDRKYEYKIHRCLYYDVCKAHGYPELTRVFCAHDHYAFDVLHKQVRFQRYGAIGDGDACCHDVFYRVTEGAKGK